MCRCFEIVPAFWLGNFQIFCQCQIQCARNVFWGTWAFRRVPPTVNTHILSPPRKYLITCVSNSFFFYVNKWIGVAKFIFQKSCFFFWEIKKKNQNVTFLCKTWKKTKNKTKTTAILKTSKIQCWEWCINRIFLYEFLGGLQKMLDYPHFHSILTNIYFNE